VYLLCRDDRGLPARERHRLADDEASQILATADPPLNGEHKSIIRREFSPKRDASV